MPPRPTIAWREPRTSDVRDRISRIAELARSDSSDTTPLGMSLRRVAGMRLEAGDKRALRRALEPVRTKQIQGFRSARVLLVSNRTLSFFAPELEVAGYARALALEVVEAPFGSVAALAHDPAFPAPAGAFDAIVLVLDRGWAQTEDSLLDPVSEAETATVVSASFLTVAAALRQRFGCLVVVATVLEDDSETLASSDLFTPGTPRRRVDSLNAALANAAGRGGFALFDLASLANRIGRDVFFDNVQFNLAKTPFAMEVAPDVADRLAAVLAAHFATSARALVLDLDNTLWGGVVADDGVEGIRLGQGSAEGEAFIAVQRMALALRARGVVLAVCSKNLEEIAREPFRSHPDMLLREEHLTAFVASFEDKATGLVKIASMLDLGVGSLAFLDDNPAERERVRSELPFVNVIEVGEDAASYPRTLIASGFFEHGRLSSEDLIRADAYRGRAEAIALRAEVGDYASYLRSLEMVLDISRFDTFGLPRISSLVQKSNQFNLTNNRYSEAEIAGFESDSSVICWQVRLKDRFADHGMISVVIVRREEHVFEIDTWVMSCRVLQRRVEEAVMATLFGLAERSNVKLIKGYFNPSARNGLVKDFFQNLGFDLVPSTVSNGSIEYCAEVASWNRPNIDVFLAINASEIT